MARPRIAGVGDSLQIWRVTANILNKQSRKADKGWSSSLGVELRVTSPHRKMQLVMKYYTEALADCLERPRKRKMDMRFGTWNVRSLWRVGSLKTLASELAKYHLDLVVVQDVRRYGVEVSQQMIIPFLWQWKH
jgi:hypothetical protein